MGRTKPFFLLLVLMYVLSACSAQATEVIPARVPATVTPARTQTTLAQVTSASTQITEPFSTQSPSALPLTEAEVSRVSVDEAKAAFDRGEAIIVDVRSVDAYAASHVAGAINIELGEIETDPTGLNIDKNKWIITYCT